METSRLAPICFALAIVCGVCDASAKKGIALNFKNFMCDDFSVLEPAMNWWYDWHLNPFYYDVDDNKQAKDCDNNADFPAYDDTHMSTVWRWNPANDLTLLDTAQALMSINEPNHYSQGNMTPAAAAEIWPQMEAAAGDLPLGSPSASPCGALALANGKCGDMFEWYDEFYALCADCRVDYTNTHWYGCRVDWLMSNLWKLYNIYKKPIWLTELACNDPDPDVVLAFMQEALPILEAKHYIYRYSWYGSRLTEDKYIKKSSSLLQQDSSALTPLGQFYLNYEYTPQ